MKIRYKAPYNLEVREEGDWIDLRATENVTLQAPKIEDGFCIFPEKPYMIPLGIAMDLPDWLEGSVLPRSSTPKTWGIIMANNEAVIDHTYRGNNDIWHFPAYALRNGEIKKGDRICQFRLQLSQKANVWQKLRWLFTNKIEFEKVDVLTNNNRGGFGKSGRN